MEGDEEFQLNAKRLREMGQKKLTMQEKKVGEFGCTQVARVCGSTSDLVMELYHGCAYRVDR